MEAQGTLLDLRPAHPGAKTSRAGATLVSGKAEPRILYESPSTLVVDKPAGLPVIPGRSPAESDCLRQWLAERYPGAPVFVVHRIDKPASGLVLFARNADAHRAYGLAFERGGVDKRYLAVVEGTPCPDTGEITFPLEESQQLRCVVLSPAEREKRRLRTAYRVLERFRHFSLLEVRLWTGFRHQIRVHLKEMGHPLAVDPLYGRRSALYLSNLKARGKYKWKEEEEKPVIARLSLHAFSIEFAEHPGGEIRRVESPPPRDFQYLVKALRKYDL